MFSLDNPFVLKSLIISFWLSITFALLGIFIFIKRMSFFSDGIAHAAVLGLAVALIFNLDILIFSLLVGIFFSILIFFLERKTKIHTDTLIGLVFVSSLSLGLILTTTKFSYQTDLLNFIIGNILTISDLDYLITIIFAIFISLILIWKFDKILLVLLDPVEAKIKKINITLYELLFYIIIGISVILGIKLVGVILVTAFLILPPAISSLISKSFRTFLELSIIFAVINVILGFLISNMYNLPLGASMVLCGSVIFFISFLVKNLLKL